MTITDYKYDMQLLAEEATERDGKDYFSLSSDEQCAYYERGMRAWKENACAHADVLRTAKKEGHL